VLQRFISPGKVVTPATDLLLISDLDSLWVQADVPEKFLADLRVGRPVEITVQAYGERIFPGRITFIGDTLNPETRTVQVRCQTDNRGRLLKPEMYATVGFELGETRQAVLISGEAIQQVDDHAVVFLREQESRFRVRRIETGRAAGGHIEVRDGLKVGEVIATTGSFLLKSELLKQQAQTE
jgi:cobalt-zinc-cadmium efflux system membrane fusion protein